jgi:outer membrane protein OmpA-like peptidoglycan-associated protein
MRILVIGFIAFAFWSALSTYIYVCKIKGLCYEPIAMQSAAISSNDTSAKPLVQEKVVIPDKLVVLFAFDKSEFISDSETDNYFNESSLFLAHDSLASLSITGHTDAIGTDVYNQALGYRRAQSMQQFFEKKGIPANKISIVSRGEKEPVADNNTKSGRANNRRAVITINK